MNTGLFPYPYLKIFVFHFSAIIERIGTIVFWVKTKKITKTNKIMLPVAIPLYNIFVKFTLRSIQALAF
jgi:hypothetical protein